MPKSDSWQPFCYADRPQARSRPALDARDLGLAGVDRANSVRPVAPAPCRCPTDDGNGPALLSHHLGLALGVLEAVSGQACLLDATGTVVATNQAWHSFNRANGGDISRTGVGVNYLAVLAGVEGEDAAAAAEWNTQLKQVLAGTVPSFAFGYRCDAPDEHRWYTARVLGLPVFGACISHVDVSDAIHAHLALTHAAHHDPITSLPNRDTIEATVAEVVASARETGTAVAVAMIDVEGIARINDSLGCATSDRLIADVAQRLSANLERDAVLGRYAGDTFVAVWRAVDGVGPATAQAEQLLLGLREPFAVAGGFVDVAASIGVAFDAWPQIGSSELVISAESAMREARTEGGGRVHLYTRDLRSVESDRWRLECEIREGLERREFTLHYQPVVDLRSGRVVGVEALARWQHPNGLRMPDSFIPIAESSGLIVQLGAQILHEACRQGAAWAADGLDLRVAVNFSAQQIRHGDVVSSIDEALRATGMQAHRLLAEVTESTVLELAERTLSVLEKIRARGIEVAIDDFGTGYNSLLYLKRYPIQALKIDRQFVSGLGATMADDAIVAGVISFARAVGATCIAEGVETPAQYEFLKALRCRFAQGHLFSPPVAAADVPTAIAACRVTLARLSSPASAVLASAGTAMEMRS